jgi:hypothetical protein
MTRVQWTVIFNGLLLQEDAQTIPSASLSSYGLCSMHMCEWKV